MRTVKWWMMRHWGVVSHVTTCAWCKWVLRTLLETSLYRSLKQHLAHTFRHFFISKYPLASPGDALAFLLSVFFRDKCHPNLSPLSEHFEMKNHTLYKMTATNGLSRSRLLLFLSLTEKTHSLEILRQHCSFFIQAEEKVVSWFDFFC